MMLMHNKHPTFTVRFTGQSTADAGLAPTDPGVADGPWVANPLPGNNDFFDDLPVNADEYTGTSKDGLFGFSWITAGLVGLGLLLRRRRF